MKELIRGAYDLHVHPAPDVLPRKLDDLELARRITASGMSGFASKSHYFCTAERAWLTRKLCPECDTVGTITLNGSVGGINPAAVEMAAPRSSTSAAPSAPAMEDRRSSAMQSRQRRFLMPGAP